MIANTLVFVCAAFGLVAGSCFEFQIPQQNSQVISIPTTSEVSQQVNIPFESCSSGSSDLSQLLSVPVASSTPSFSFSSGSSGASDAFAQILANAAASGSGIGAGAGLQATNGPSSSPLQVIEASPVTLPAVEGPIITLSSQPIPAPRVLSQRCICTKTIVKPQVYTRTVTVPKVQRYLKRTVTPVVENLSYKSTPIAQPEVSSASLASSGSGLFSGSGLISGSGLVSESALGSGLVSGLVSGSQSFVPVSSSSSSCPRIC